MLHKSEEYCNMMIGMPSPLDTPAVQTEKPTIDLPGVSQSEQQELKLEDVPF